MRDLAWLTLFENVYGVVGGGRGRIGTNTQVDLRHIDEVEGSNVVDIGMDLSEFYMSVEWDILEVPAVRYVTASLSLCRRC